MTNKDGLKLSPKQLGFGHGISCTLVIPTLFTPETYWQCGLGQWTNQQWVVWHHKTGHSIFFFFFTECVFCSETCQMW